MKSSKEVTISAKVDKEIAVALKKQAKEQEIRFSSYIRRILIKSVEQKKQQK